MLGLARSPGLAFFKAQQATKSQLPLGGAVLVRPDLVDAIVNGEVALLVNTPAGPKSAHDDSYIRKAAIRARVPYVAAAGRARPGRVDRW